VMVGSVSPLETAATAATANAAATAAWLFLAIASEKNLLAIDDNKPRIIIGGRYIGQGSFVSTRAGNKVDAPDSKSYSAIP